MLRRITALILACAILFAPVNIPSMDTNHTMAVDENIYYFSDGSGSYVILPDGVTASTKIHGYSINEQLLKEEGILVFGDHGDVEVDDDDPPQEKDKDGDWRYLGYTLSGDPFSNREFDNDADSGREPWERIMIPYPWLEDLCNRSPFEGDPAYEATLLDILDVNDFPEWFTLAMVKKYFYVQSVLGPGTQSVVRYWHKTSSGKVWYETLKGSIDRIGDPIIESSVEAMFGLEDRVYEYQDIGYKDTSKSSENAYITVRRLTVTGSGGYHQLFEYDQADDAPVIFKVF